ncbi:MAG: glycosyltransferase [Lewinellaceae bacterium]|nr:glycosyltransferase [Lewinellaceae bacterium]
MLYDIVIFSLFRTDNPYSSISLSMAKELARTTRVFYVNHPYSFKDILTGWLSGNRILRSRLPDLLRGRPRYEALPEIPDNFVALQPPPTWPVNWLPKGVVYDFFQRINNRIVLRAIRRLLRDHRVRRYAYINCYDPFFAGVLPPEMGAVKSIYHCIDDISQDPYTAKHGEDLENAAICAADLTLVTSGRLFQLKSRLSDRIAPFFNAADVSLFETALTESYPRPAELEGSNGKVIGFIGNLDGQRIDYPLLKRTALAHPDKTLLLVGPVNSKEPHAIGLDKLPNVVMTGSRKLSELPALLQHMDIALIPFCCNKLTESIYPLKINEYLAAGKPVVATSFSADIRRFSGLVYLAASHDDFLEQIEASLRENDPALREKRSAFARQNSWPARILELRELIDVYSGIEPALQYEENERA